MNPQFLTEFIFSVDFHVVPSSANIGDDMIVLKLFPDGVNEVKAMMQLLVRLITEEILFNSITVRLNDMTAEQFLSPLLAFFIDGLAAIIPCPKENIYIFSVQVRPSLYFGKYIEAKTKSSIKNSATNNKATVITKFLRNRIDPHMY